MVLMQTAARIAFIGLGQMGLPMAANLLKAGYEVVGFDLSLQALQKLVSEGGRAAKGAADAMAGSDVIIAMLSNGKVVRSVLVEEEAYLRAPKGALLLEMSSSAPEETRSLAEAVSGHLRVVDAPVSGGVKRAVDGTLAVMAGGADADFLAATPVLEAMSAKIFHCGPVGAGHAMKAINNYVSGAGVIAAVEAVLLGNAFGLDEAKVVEVLNASSGKNNATEVKMNQFILSGTFGSGFALGLMAKDIRTAANLSVSLGLSQQGLTQAADLWDDAARTLGGAVDHTRFYDYLKRQVG
jgi:3-hydroxyisobutyrate dehydrogenase